MSDTLLQSINRIFLDYNKIIVKKNDSIKRRINQIISNFEENSEILLVSNQSSIGKLLTILEISKTKLAGVVQYNKLDGVMEGGKKIPVLYVVLMKGEGKELIEDGWTFQGEGV